MKPLHSFIDKESNSLKLIPQLKAWFNGDLSLPADVGDLPGVYSNFVMTLDGRISFNQPGHMGGGDISLGNIDDRRIMALLRATTDAILVGANTLRLEDQHVWTPEFILPDDLNFIDLVNYQRLEMGKADREYLHFFITGSGKINPQAAVLSDKNADVCFITTRSGQEEINSLIPSNNFKILVVENKDNEREVDVLEALKIIKERFKVKNLLCEGGPKVIGLLINCQALNQAFLSISNQVIGNSPQANKPDRPSWVSNYFGQPGESIRLEKEYLKFDSLQEMEFQSNKIIYP
jgi:riboflavin biosynthesis pyrimidine reductase